MIIKKFQARTEEEAIAIAKNEMGENVVVMSSRNIKRKGLFAFLKKPLVEITVGMEEESERQISDAISAIAKTAKSSMMSSSASPRPSLSAASAASAYSAGAATKSTPATEASSYSKTNNSGDSAIVLEKRLDSLQSLLEQQLTKENDEDDFVPTPDDASMKFLKLIYNTLIENEVAEKYVNEIMDEVGKIRNPKSNIDVLLSNIYQKMILKFGQADTISLDGDKKRVIFFIGPTGVGKTTTIAKLASDLCVNHKKKVALLTTDTYRIAATEQLKTYAGILKIPCKVIYTDEELMNSVNEFEECQYILVDTAGHSHHNDEQKEAISHYLKSVDDTVEKDIYLVLSATTKYKDLLSIADSYSEITDYKLIFTKLDETTTLGNLFNICMHTGSSMSYVTCGQNVPNDIEVFSPQSTVKLLLGGK